VIFIVIVLGVNGPLVMQFPSVCFFLMCVYLIYAEISTECHHIALWVLCRTQLWGQSGEKGMHV